MVWVPDKYKRKRQRSLALPDTPRPVHLNCTPPGQYYLADLLRRSDEIKQQQQMAKSTIQSLRQFLNGECDG